MKGLSTDSLHENRFITIIGLVQAGLVVLFWGVTSFHLKAMGYPEFGLGLRWNPCSLFIRNWAFVLFLVPVFWVLGSLLAIHSDRWAFRMEWIILAGIAITAALTLFLMVNSFDVSTRLHLLLIGD